MAEALLKAHTLTLGPPPGESSQKEEGDWLRTPNEAFEPPLPMESLRELTQINDVRATCIESIATNTVGLGYSLEVEVSHEREVQDASADIERATALLETLAGRDVRLNRPSLTELLYAVKHDEEEIGWGFIEVSRSKLTGEITGLYHVPAWRMRRRKRQAGYYLLDHMGSGIDNPTAFYDFGTKVKYTADGKPRATLQPGKRWGVNEVICFRLYTSESRDYGLPRDVAMMLEYLGDKLSKESNISFFDSSGTPPTLIFVAGEETKEGGRVTFKVPQQTVDRIASTLKSDSGHRHRVAIVPVPPGTKAEQFKLGEFSDRDVGFTNFRQDIARRTVSSFRLQPIFIPAVEEQGKYAAEVQRAITLEQLFDPEQSRYEATLGETLLRELGFGHLRLNFKRLAVEDNKTRRDSADRMAENKAITRREYRAAHGFPPLPEAAEGATPKAGQVPFGWNDELVEKPKPEGAENREPFDDTRGQRPGIGGREPDPRREQKDPATETRER
jgi:capsid portal protein